MVISHPRRDRPGGEHSDRTPECPLGCLNDEDCLGLQPGRRNAESYPTPDNWRSARAVRMSPHL